MITRWLRTVEDNGAIVTYPDDSTLLSYEIEERDAVIDRIGATSIWTAELVWELHQHILPHLQNQKHQYLFCSRTFQVENDHKDIGYYQSQFTTDQARVSNVFQKLKQNQKASSSMMCLPHGIPLEHVVQATNHPCCVAIVLIDNSILIGPSSQLTSDDNSSGNNNDQYQGHYVILCGTSRCPTHIESARKYCVSEEFTNNEDVTNDGTHDYCLVVCNPNRYTPWMYITSRRFETARRSNGTDEDIIIVIRNDEKT